MRKSQSGFNSWGKALIKIKNQVVNSIPEVPFNLKAKLKYFAKKLIADSLYYLSMSMMLIFTIGGTLFCVPPIGEFLRLGSNLTLGLGVFCTIGAFLSSYFVYKHSMLNLVYEVFGLDLPKNQSNTQNTSNHQASLKNHLIYGVATILVFFMGVFYIGGNFFAAQQLLPYIGMQQSSIAAVVAFSAAIINNLPTFALNGRALINSFMGKSTDIGVSQHTSGESGESIEHEHKPCVIPDRLFDKCWVNCYVGEHTADQAIDHTIAQARHKKDSVDQVVRRDVSFEPIPRIARP